MWYAERRPLGTPNGNALAAGFTEKRTARDAIKALLRDEVLRWQALDPEQADKPALALQDIEAGADTAEYGGVVWRVFEQ